MADEYLYHTYHSVPKNAAAAIWHQQNGRFHTGVRSTSGSQPQKVQAVLSTSVTDNQFDSKASLGTGEEYYKTTESEYQYQSKLNHGENNQYQSMGDNNQYKSKHNLGENIQFHSKLNLGENNYYHSKINGGEEHQYYASPYATNGYNGVVNGTFRTPNYNGASLNGNLAAYKENMYVKVGYNGKEIPVYGTNTRPIVNIRENNDYQNEEYENDTCTENENVEDPPQEGTFKPSSFKSSGDETSSYKETIYQEPTHQRNKKIPGVMVWIEQDSNKREIDTYTMLCQQWRFVNKNQNILILFRLL